MRCERRRSRAVVRLDLCVGPKTECHWTSASVPKPSVIGPLYRHQNPSAIGPLRWVVSVPFLTGSPPSRIHLERERAREPLERAVRGGERRAVQPRPAVEHAADQRDGRAVAQPRREVLAAVVRAPELGVHELAGARAHTHTHARRQVTHARTRQLFTGTHTRARARARTRTSARSQVGGTRNRTHPFSTDSGSRGPACSLPARARPRARVPPAFAAACSLGAASSHDHITHRAAGDGPAKTGVHTGAPPTSRVSAVGSSATLPCGARPAHETTRPSHSRRMPLDGWFLPVCSESPS